MSSIRINKGLFRRTFVIIAPEVSNVYQFANERLLNEFRNGPIHVEAEVLNKLYSSCIH